MLATGCNDDDDMPGGQFQLTQSGRIDLTVDYQKADTVVLLTVLNRSMETNSVQLVNFTQTELDAYNQRWNTHFLMIPEDAYQLTQTSVSFTRGEAQKSVDVTFYPSVLYSHLMSQVNTAYSYCLPLKMQNGATDQEIVYAVTLTYPEMRLRDTELSVKMDYLTKDVTVSASIFAYLGTEQPNGEQVEFTLAMPDDKEAWLARYNVANNTYYTLLPEA